jgi:hypothetical protein
MLKYILCRSLHRREELNTSNKKKFFHNTLYRIEIKYQHLLFSTYRRTKKIFYKKNALFILRFYLFLNVQNVITNNKK